MSKFNIFMRLLVLLLVSGLFVSCGNTVPYVTPPVSNTIDLNPQHWDILYSSGMPPHPAPLSYQEGVWYFTIPQSPGEVDYVEVPFHATTNPYGGSVTLKFKVVSVNPVYNAVIKPGSAGPATFHIFFETYNDDLSTPYGRWWCDAGGYILGTQDNQEITFTCPLEHKYWSAVYGGSDQSDFYNSLNIVGFFGITYGGSNEFGHGINMLSGSSQFQLVNYTIDFPPVPVVQ